MTKTWEHKGEGKTPLKLNFKLDQPTINGHLYDKKRLINQFEERVDSNIFIIISNPNAFIQQKALVDLNEMVGSVRRFEISKDGEVTFWCDLDLLIDEYIKEVGMEVSTYGMGKIDSNKNIKEFKLIGLFLTHTNEEIINFLKGGRQCIIKALKERVMS